ncbi:MAG: YggS family pyridoxal phosphate-dependent enzyme [Nitrospirota bacterium]|nr:YggS family pyridoxal phosphate-dependent enzyme [Nitrospirota bacterium]
MSGIAENLKHIEQRIAEAAREAGRDPADVHLVVVSKTFPAGTVREAISAGAAILGESRIQEAKAKIAEIGPAAANVSWHLIGHLQSNKAKTAVEMFDLIHSVDSLHLAEEINRQAAKAGKVQRLLIEVNVAGEESKFGINPDELLELIKALAPLKNIVVEGLMTIPPYADDPEVSRPYFRRLAALAVEVDTLGIAGIRMKELSMGMSGDFEVAVQEGATLVRVGTAIFGAR